MIVRHFLVDDALLIQRSRTIRLHFINYMASFSAFDADFNAAFAANWLLSIEACTDYPTDETTVDELGGLTAEISKAEKAGFSAANDLEYYVKKAFPGDKSMLEEFGFTERKMARMNSLNLMIWLSVMKKVGDDYLAELTAAGMPPTVLPAIALQSTNTVGKEIDQEYFKRLRKRLARERVKKFNALYSYYTHVNSAAQIVFANEKEERELFVL